MWPQGHRPQAAADAPPSRGYQAAHEGTSRARQSQDLINRRRARHVCGEYDLTSIESEDMDMSIRGKGILTTLAIALIGTTPAWSQSLLKTLDPDHDGTVDLANANSAAGSTPRISPPPTPTTTELWTRMNFSRSWRSASTQPIPIMTGRLTPRNSRARPAVP